MFPETAISRTLPDEVGKMLREANDSERGTIENVVKRLYPDPQKEIDDLIDDIEDEEKAKVATSPYTKGWAGDISLGTNWSGGKQWGFNAGLNLKRESPIWEHDLIAYVDLSDREGERTAERMGLSYRVRRDFRQSPWFIFVYGGYERNRPQGISRRFTEIVGGGYQVIDTDDLDWEVSAGPAMRQTRYVDSEDENRFALSFGTDLEYELNDRLTLEGRSSAVFDEENTSLSSDTALKNNIYGRISGKISFGATYESNPIEDKDKVDTYAQASIPIEM